MVFITCVYCIYFKTFVDYIIDLAARRCISPAQRTAPQTSYLSQFTVSHCVVKTSHQTFVTVWLCTDSCCPTESPSAGHEIKVVFGKFEIVLQEKAIVEGHQLLTLIVTVVNLSMALFCIVSGIHRLACQNCEFIYPNTDLVGNSQPGFTVKKTRMIPKELRS